MAPADFTWATIVEALESPIVEEKQARLETLYSG